MKIHIVKKGDTLFELSKKYNVPLQKLIDANPQIANPDQLNLGDKVKIPAAAAPVDGDGTNTYKHTVKEGDSLWKLAKAWGLPLQALVDANPQLVDPNVLSVGQVINIPGSGSTITAESAGQNQQAPNVSGQENKKNTAPIATGPNNKKNNAPIESPITTMPPAPTPAPAPTPKPAPVPAPEAVKEEKKEAMPIPIQLEIGVEHVNYEPMKYENIHFENVKPEPSPCPPMPEYPVLPSPFQYQVEQPTYVSPVSHYPSSPCGCSDKGPKMENENLFYQHHVSAEKVSANYEYPQHAHMQPFMGNQPITGEYPGVSFAPSYQMPDNTGLGPVTKGYPTAPIMEHPMENIHSYPNEMYGGVHQQHGFGWPMPYAPSSCCGSYPVYPHHYEHHQHHDMFYPQIQPGYGYPPVMPEPYGGFMAPGIPVQPTVPVAPLGGFGVSEPFMIDRDTQLAQSSEAADVTAADRGEKAKAKADPKKEKAKKDVKVSGVTANGMSGKKRAGASSSRNQVKKTGKRNPWINN